jgi:hypothetical protein
MVLTGGPGAGKTAVLELVRHYFCEHVHVLPEAAGIVFGGGFPRRQDLSAIRAAQRAILCVQRELEAAAEGENPAIILCDRGTIDGGAYWPGPDDFFTSVGTTLSAELRRYSAVIHLRCPAEQRGYDHRNPLRVESAAQALDVDRRLLALWSPHPRRCIVEPTAHFLSKARTALELIRAELPACCRHGFPELDDMRPAQATTLG